MTTTKTEFELAVEKADAAGSDTIEISGWGLEDELARGQGVDWARFVMMEANRIGLPLRVYGYKVKIKGAIPA